MESGVGGMGGSPSIFIKLDHFPKDRGENPRYTPGSLTSRPGKMMGLEDDPASFWGPVYFQGLSVKLQVGA